MQDDGRKALIKKIAAERIELIFENTNKTINSDQALAHRYVKTLRKISTHYKVPLPKKMRNTICRNCDVLLVPGLNASVRIVSSHRYVATVCNKCKKEIHVRY